MTKPVAVRRSKRGLRCWILGQRVHHGATGCVLLACSRRHPAVALVAAALILHDRADWRVWFAREALDSARKRH